MEYKKLKIQNKYLGFDKDKSLINYRTNFKYNNFYNQGWDNMLRYDSMIKNLDKNPFYNKGFDSQNKYNNFKHLGSKNNYLPKLSIDNKYPMINSRIKQSNNHYKNQIAIFDKSNLLLNQSKYFKKK